MCGASAIRVIALKFAFDMYMVVYNYALDVIFNL